MSNDLISQALDGDIFTVHERFVTVMAQRVPAMPVDSKERYFALLSLLVTKLEDPEKPMPDILREMMAEAAAILMQELGAPR